MTTSLRAEHLDSGVVHVPAALDDEALRSCRAAFEWSLAHPGPGASPLLPGTEGRSHQDLANPAARTAREYQAVLTGTPIASLVGELWGESDVWFMYEQVFVKDGGQVDRTPWHQDSSYLPVDGDHLAVVWITFDPVDRDGSLEFVRGSHRGPLYATSRFDPVDETLPIWEGLPHLPPIEAERDRWDIVSWAVEPGDVLIFHPKVLHGGAATRAGARRRTLSLRFFGPDAVVAHRPGGAGASLAPGLASLRDGEPFRAPAFPRVPLPTAR
jgi:ectoine hydroxylase-related dioxygenase (phytanoyl-CoA dioxygenase family)